MSNQSSQQHMTPSQADEFCALRQAPCGCPRSTNYIKNSRDKAPGWANYLFLRRQYMKTGEVRTIEKKPEAHHILCTSSVRDFLIANAEVFPMIRETEWCVNQERNVRPMPLWGHTVLHYCSVQPGLPRGVLAQPLPPLFVNIPQHDIDHNVQLGYRFEVDEDVRYLASQVQMAMEAHQIDPEDIKGSLDDLSAKYDDILTERGNRQGGTHAAWLDAANDANPRWYEPFSMASTPFLTDRGFPKTFTAKSSEWMDRLAFALWGAQ
ncbi:hypothetical protein WMF38_50570 [Sorangium sp. So ce118]